MYFHQVSENSNKREQNFTRHICSFKSEEKSTLNRKNVSFSVGRYAVCTGIMILSEATRQFIVVILIAGIQSMIA